MRPKLRRARPRPLGRLRDTQPLDARRQNPLKKPQHQLRSGRTTRLPNRDQRKLYPSIHGLQLRSDAREHPRLHTKLSPSYGLNKVTLGSLQAMRLLVLTIKWLV
jgi:hypothetical protein